MIDRFVDEYRFLSNFYPSSIKYKGIRYASVEHAYQAQKSRDVQEQRQVAAMKRAYDAKVWGKNRKPEGWHKRSINIMHQLVFLKFVNHPSLKKMLLDTGDQELVEGNDWGDTFWGKVDGVGHNHLGKILMKVREELREGTYEPYGTLPTPPKEDPL